MKCPNRTTSTLPVYPNLPSCIDPTWGSVRLRLRWLVERLLDWLRSWLLELVLGGMDGLAAG